VELTCGTCVIVSESKISLENQRTNWRRGRDSNPRYGYPYNGPREWHDPSANNAGCEPLIWTYFRVSGAQ